MEWSQLNNHCSHFLNDIRKEWDELMKSDDVEEKYHKFLADHSAMCWGTNIFFTISKLNFYGEYTPDFVLVDERSSLGLEYTLVEIEKPSTVTITQQENPSAALTHAMKQIRDWKHWIERNSQNVGSIFPSKFSHETNTHIKYMLIAGKRSSITHEQQAERIRVANEVGYDIRSFDFITDNLKNFRAKDYILPNSDINQQHWNDGLFHQFANPFYRSLSNEAWKEICTSPDFVRSHMIGKNLKLLNARMTVNEKYDQFIKLTKKSG